MLFIFFLALNRISVIDCRYLSASASIDHNFKLKNSDKRKKLKKHKISRSKINSNKKSRIRKRSKKKLFLNKKLNERQSTDLIRKSNGLVKKSNKNKKAKKLLKNHQKRKSKKVVENYYDGEEPKDDRTSNKLSDENLYKNDDNYEAGDHLIELDNIDNLDKDKDNIHNNLITTQINLNTHLNGLINDDFVLDETTEDYVDYFVKPDNDFKNFKDPDSSKDKNIQINKTESDASNKINEFVILANFSLINAKSNPYLNDNTNDKINKDNQENSITDLYENESDKNNYSNDFNNEDNEDNKIDDLNLIINKHYTTSSDHHIDYPNNSIIKQPFYVYNPNPNIYSPINDHVITGKDNLIKNFINRRRALEEHTSVNHTGLSFLNYLGLSLILFLLVLQVMLLLCPRKKREKFRTKIKTKFKKYKKKGKRKLDDESEYSLIEKSSSSETPAPNSTESDTFNTTADTSYANHRQTPDRYDKLSKASINEKNRKSINKSRENHMKMEIKRNEKNRTAIPVNQCSLIAVENENKKGKKDKLKDSKEKNMKDKSLERLEFTDDIELNENNLKNNLDNLVRINRLADISIKSKNELNKNNKRKDDKTKQSSLEDNVSSNEIEINLNSEQLDKQEEIKLKTPKSTNDYEKILIDLSGKSYGKQSPKLNGIGHNQVPNLQLEAKLQPKLKWNKENETIVNIEDNLDGKFEKNKDQIEHNQIDRDKGLKENKAIIDKKVEERRDQIRNEKLEERRDQIRNEKLEDKREQVINGKRFESVENKRLEEKKDQEMNYNNSKKVENKDQIINHNKLEEIKDKTFDAKRLEEKTSVHRNDRSDKNNEIKERLMPKEKVKGDSSTKKVEVIPVDWVTKVGDKTIFDKNVCIFEKDEKMITFRLIQNESFQID